MRFRLFYEGPLRSANGDPRQGQTDKLRDHKQSIREVFSSQMYNLWCTHPSLRAARSNGEIFGNPFGESLPLLQAIARRQPVLSGKRFVPLVCSEFDLLCKLDILLLRKDKPGGIIYARDIDNRLKVIFDALRVPQHEGEIGGSLESYPYENMCVLLQDDSLITHVSVETDELLGAPKGSLDDYVRMMITVDLSVYRSTMFNIGIF